MQCVSSIEVLTSVDELDKLPLRRETFSSSDDEPDYCDPVEQMNSQPMARTQGEVCATGRY